MSMITEKYAAVVVSTDDPEKRGRVRASCTGLLGDDDAELPFWIEPALDWGWFLLPDPGEQIEIEVVVASGEDESHGQASLDNMDARWRGARFIGGAETTQPVLIHPLFLETYGKRRGFATPWGHVIMFDDTPNAGSVQIHFSTVPAAHAEPTLHTVTLDKDGIKQNVGGQHTTQIKPTGEVEIVLNGLNAMKVTSALLPAPTVETILGDGAVAAAIADHLQDLYGLLKTYIETAAVQTAMGISSTIGATMGPAPEWDPAINSNRLKFPDNT